MVTGNLKKLSFLNKKQDIWRRKKCHAFKIRLNVWYSFYQLPVSINHSCMSVNFLFIVRSLQYVIVTGNKQKNLYLEYEQESQKIFPAVWEEYGKSPKAFRLFRKGNVCIPDRKYLGTQIPAHAWVGVIIWWKGFFAFA